MGSGASEPRVLIAGAGPVGLVAAIELARRGAAVRIIDKNAERTGLSKAVGVNARSLEVLEPSGVAPALIDAGLKVRRINLRYDGEALAAVDFSRLDHRYNFILCLPQSETEAVLEAALEARGVAVERETELVGFAQDDAGVDAAIARGGATERQRFDYLVGADGAHSTVRKTLGLGFDGEPYPDEWSLADVRLDWPFGDEDGDLFMRPDGKVLFVVALGGGRHRAISNDGHALDLLPSGSTVSEILWQTEFRVSLRQVSRYQEGRAFLAGDAAHIHSPAGGRGMNLGIEDAATLAEMIVEGGLADYSAARHRVGVQVVRDSDRMFRMAALHHPVAVAARNVAIRHVLGSELVQSRFRRRMAGLSA